MRKSRTWEIRGWKRPTTRLPKHRTLRKPGTRRADDQEGSSEEAKRGADAKTDLRDVEPEGTVRDLEQTLRQDRKEDTRNKEGPGEEDPNGDIDDRKDLTAEDPKGDVQDREHAEDPDGQEANREVHEPRRDPARAGERAGEPHNQTGCRREAQPQPG